MVHQIFVRPILAEIGYSDVQIGAAIVELEDLEVGKITVATGRALGSQWPISQGIVANRRQDLLDELYLRWTFDCEVSSPDDRPELPKILADRWVEGDDLEAAV